MSQLQELGFSKNSDKLPVRHSALRTLQSHSHPGSSIPKATPPMAHRPAAESSPAHSEQGDCIQVQPLSYLFSLAVQTDLLQHHVISFKTHASCLMQCVLLPHGLCMPSTTHCSCLFSSFHLACPSHLPICPTFLLLSGCIVCFDADVLVLI